MGMFSWITSDTQESIPASGAARPTFTVYMVAPNGKHYQEDGYNGYGDFGGKDFFELTAEINPELEKDIEDIRARGLEIYYSEVPSVVMRRRLPRLCRYLTPWERLQDSAECPDQGIFYPTAR